MKRRFVSLALVLVVGGVFLSSCEKEDPLSDKKEVLSFVFEASKNATLDHNVLGVLNGTTITASVPFGTDVSKLIPTIEVSPNAQLSPADGVATDFSSQVSYTVTAEDGSSKEFITTVPIQPAPYIGKWESSAINFGLGLMYIVVEIDDAGEIVLELKELVSGELNKESIKGYFDPFSLPHQEVQITQTQRWIDRQWTDQENYRAMMYHFDAGNKMRFYYCYCYPKDSWAFEVDLSKK